MIIISSGFEAVFKAKWHFPDLLKYKLKEVGFDDINDGGF